MELLFVSVVVLFSYLLNMGRVRKISRQEQFIMVWDKILGNQAQIDAWIKIITQTPIGFFTYSGQIRKRQIMRGENKML